MVKQGNKKVEVLKSFIFEVACNEELTKKDYKVFLWLLTRLDDEIFIEISQKEICIDLYMDKSSISKSISNLLDQKIIEKRFFEKNSYRFCKYKDLLLFLND